MLSWLSALAAGLAAVGFQALHQNRMPRSMLGARVSDAGIFVAGLAGAAAGTAGRTASTVVEKSILVAGASLATGAGLAIDALAAPLTATPAKSTSAHQPPGPRAA